MKITLEPTDSLDIDPRYSPAKVVVEVPYDPDTITEVIKNLIIPVLLG